MPLSSFNMIRTINPWYFSYLRFYPKFSIMLIIFSNIVFLTSCKRDFIGNLYKPQ